MKGVLTLPLLKDAMTETQNVALFHLYTELQHKTQAILSVQINILNLKTTTNILSNYLNGTFGLTIENMAELRNMKHKIIIKHTKCF